MAASIGRAGREQAGREQQQQGDGDGAHQRGELSGEAWPRPPGAWERRCWRWRSPGTGRWAGWRRRGRAAPGWGPPPRCAGRPGDQQDSDGRRRPPRPGRCRGVAEQRFQVGQFDGREDQVGRPSGSTPMTFTPSVSRSNRATAAMPTSTATMTRGSSAGAGAGPGSPRCRSPRWPARPGSPAPSATPLTKSRISVSRPWPSIEKPHSLELPDQDGDGDLGQVAELHRTRQQLGHEPQPGDAGDQDDQPGRTARASARATAVSSPPPRGGSRPRSPPPATSRSPAPSSATA